MAVRWHTLFTLSWVPRKSYGGLTASLRRPQGALTAAVRQTCYSCKNREVAVRSPPGLLVVTLRSPYGFWFHKSYDRRAVAITICDHNYRRPQDLTILKNHVLPTVDCRTVRWPYGGSMICDRGISDYIDLGNFEPGNGLLPDGSKILHETMTPPPPPFLWFCSQQLFCTVNLKIVLSTLFPHIAGANDLNEHILNKMRGR